MKKGSQVKWKSVGILYEGVISNVLYYLEENSKNYIYEVFVDNKSHLLTEEDLD